MRLKLASVLVATLLSVAVPAGAQLAPSAETMKLATALMVKVSGDREATLKGLAAPMVGMMQQMGVTQMDRAEALVSEAVMPLLTDHIDELMAASAKSYATVLSEADLRAAIAFYDTPAGQHLIQKQAQLAQAKLSDVTRWMTALQPEMQKRVQQTLVSHGWDKD